MLLFARFLESILLCFTLIAAQAYFWGVRECSAGGGAISLVS